MCMKSSSTSQICPMWMLFMKQPPWKCSSDLTNELSVGCTFEHGMPIVSICLWLVQFLGGLIQRQTFSAKKGLLSGKSTFQENALGGKKNHKKQKLKYPTKTTHNQPLVSTEMTPLQKKKGFLKSVYIFHGVGLKHLLIFHLCMTRVCSSNSIQNITIFVSNVSVLKCIL